ncbi:MAG: squalene--hopene cyclase, partial [Planctomycetes bacterium]|nr:squalene--hopene cyclase [Planctomycetota bacterium]
MTPFFRQGREKRLSRHGRIVAVAIGLAVLGCVAAASAQIPLTHYGDAVPRDVREMYDRGLQYLANTQTTDGEWTGGEQGPGTTGLGLMVFLASGEDPNFGLYRNHVRRALRHIISSQNESTGYLGSSMYHHGFGMLALAEAYGAVDDRDLWPPGQSPAGRSIGVALELAVRAAITSQKKNSNGAWRYTPDSSDADTSVSGAVLVGLLAARNAGIEVPDTAIDKAISYYKSMTSGGGQVGYSGIGSGGSLARSSIATLVYALARRKDLSQYEATLRYVRDNREQTTSPYAEYTLYYQSQALFQGDVEAWE